MTARVSRAKAVSSPLYREARDKCIELGQRNGRFSKLEVIESLEWWGVDPDFLRWDYLCESIEADFPVTLTAVTAAIFTREGERDAREHPDRYLAGLGHGRTTAGYVWVTRENDPVILAKTRRERAVLQGKAKSFQERTTRIAQERRALELPDAPLLALIQKSDEIDFS